MPLLFVFVLARRCFRVQMDNCLLAVLLIKENNFNYESILSRNSVHYSRIQQGANITNLPVIYCYFINLSPFSLNFGHFSVNSNSFCQGFGSSTKNQIPGDPTILCVSFRRIKILDAQRIRFSLFIK